MLHDCIGGTIPALYPGNFLITAKLSLDLMAAES